MPSKFALFAAAGRLARRVLEPPAPDDGIHGAAYELPAWAYRKANGDTVHRWHDLRPTGDEEAAE
jgi:hypothetical protein